MENKEKTKLSLPVSIIIGCIILGVFYYITSVNKRSVPNEVQQKSGVVADEKIPTKIEPKLNTNQQIVVNKALQDVRNAQRRSDVLTILNAIYQYSIDNNGVIPKMPLGTNCASFGTDAINLTDKLVGNNSDYLKTIPSDPISGNQDASSGYFVISTPSGRVTVCAPLSVGEGNIAPGDTSHMISVTR